MAEQMTTDRSEIVIAGHSHIFQMGAQQGYRGDLQIQPMPDYAGVSFLMEEWKGFRSPAYWEYLLQNATGKLIAIVYNGNQHNAGFLLTRTPFDFWHPATKRDLIPGAAIVPLAMVKEYFIASLKELESVLERLKSADAKDVVVVGTPPVKANVFRYRDEVLKSDYFRTQAKRIGVDIDTIQFTPALVRMKLWRVIQDLMSDMARKNNFEFLPVCPSAQDEHGYLLERYYGAGVTHANNDYGFLMLNAVRQFFRDH